MKQLNMTEKALEETLNEPGLSRVLKGFGIADVHYWVNVKGKIDGVEIEASYSTFETKGNADTRKLIRIYFHYPPKLTKNLLGMNSMQEGTALDEGVYIFKPFRRLALAKGYTCTNAYTAGWSLGLDGVEDVRNMLGRVQRDLPELKTLFDESAKVFESKLPG